MAAGIATALALVQTLRLHRAQGAGSALFLIILLLMLGYVTLFVLFSTLPVTILGATIFGVLGLGIALSVAVTWFPAWPFAESLIVGGNLPIARRDLDSRP